MEVRQVRTSTPYEPGFEPSLGGDLITEKDEDRGRWLAGLALVLEVAQLLLELL